MSLIRTSLVVGAIVLALPLPTGVQHAAKPESWHLMSAASESFSDVKAFCNQRPEVCTTADKFASQIEAKARFGLTLISTWATEAVLPDYTKLGFDQAKADQIMTGTTAAAVPLTISDLVSGWKGPIYPE
jgi:hypothetical protein